MILQALCDYYERLREQSDSGIAPPGYSSEKISYALVLDRDGLLVAIRDIRDTSGKKPVPTRLIVPQPPKRASNIAPCFLWDKTSYVLGVSASSKRTQEEHAAFKELHAVLIDADDVGLQALARFLQNWGPEQFATRPDYEEDTLDANCVFELDGEHGYLHDRPAARAAWAVQSAAASDMETAMCLVTGKRMLVARLHPSIKGVDSAQSSGASIVSFNLDAFESYGKAQGYNAPVSEPAAFAYTTALNYLLRRSEHNRQRLRIGDTTVVFWVQAGNAAGAEAAEDLMSQMLNPPATDEQQTSILQTVLDAVRQGRPLTTLSAQLQPDTRIFILGLAPNASRLAIRFWITGTLQTFAVCIATHFDDLALQPPAWKSPPSIWRLALTTAPQRAGQKSKAEDIPPQLAGELTRAVLTGNRYPRSLLATLLMRMRADGQITDLRVALCKAVLVRDRRLHVKGIPKEIPMSLDLNNHEPGYLLGRLFAELENTQRAALGKAINAPIGDRYYGAASATPASVFPLLLRGARHHLSRLRKDKPGLAHTLDQIMGDIVSELGTRFPRHLSLEAQGQFVIGYYQQRNTRFSKPGDIEDDASPDSGENE